MSNVLISSDTCSGTIDYSLGARTSLIEIVDVFLWYPMLRSCDSSCVGPGSVLGPGL